MGFNRRVRFASKQKESSRLGKSWNKGTEVRRALDICMERDLLWIPAQWLNRVVVIKFWLKRHYLLFSYYAKGTIHL